MSSLEYVSCRFVQGSARSGTILGVPTPHILSSSLMKRFFSTVFLSASLISVSALSTGSLSPTSTAWAEKRESMKKRLEREKTVRRQRLMRAGRLELSGSLGASLGDAYQRNYPIGVAATYHLNDRWGIRGGGFFALSSETSLAEEIRALRPKRVTPNSFTSVGLGFGADVLYTMIYGKFSPLGIGAIRYDLALTGGVGMLQSVSGTVSAFKIAPNVGINSHFFLSDQIAVGVFYKLYVYSYTDHQLFVDNKPALEESWSGHSFGGLAFSFFTGKVKVSAE